MTHSSTVPVKTTNGTTSRRAEPLALFDDFAAELEHWWSRPFSFFPAPFLRSFRGAGRAPFALTPAMDVYEKDNVVYVKAELPGLKKEDVTVQVDGDQLTIRGESKSESEVKDEQYYRSERTFGSFFRRMPLPAGVKAEQIQATLKDGVLEVSIPKPAVSTSEPTKIPVS